MNNRFNDPFYAESSYLRTTEESGVYDKPAGPEQKPSLPAGWSVTGNTGASTGTSTGTGGSSTSGGSKVNWDAIIQNTPQLLNAAGTIVGTIGSMKNQGGTKDTVKAVCGRKPLFNFGGKKDRYRECAERVLNPPPPPPPPTREGMSTTTKVLIGVGAFIFLAVMIFVIIKLSNRDKSK